MKIKKVHLQIAYFRNYLRRKDIQLLEELLPNIANNWNFQLLGSENKSRKYKKSDPTIGVVENLLLALPFFCTTESMRRPLEDSKYCSPEKYRLSGSRSESDSDIARLRSNFDATLTLYRLSKKRIYPTWKIANGFQSENSDFET